MTDKEKAAQEYEENAECIEVDDYGRKVYGCLEIEQAWLAGFEAGKPKWHDLREDPTDLPKEKCDVLNENGNTLHYDSGYFYKDYIFCTKEYPIAWCEMPKYEE